ncbi:MAG TPA: ABC transporter ATP-binding protein, partial [Microlunatus sp.]|nr:ABC transporter ATP-binding protein [Microlunatus sp.]
MITTEPTTTTPGLRLDGLTKVLGGRTIVEDLRLDIAPGELVALLGPSGCGKTTTLRMIAGFLRPDAGRVEVAGEDVTGLGPEKRPSAMVFQNYALWPHMTVAKNVAFPLRIARVPRAEINRRVAEVLELVGLSHHADSRPARISGGEQQRAALARALVQRPKLLLLDEPLSNLDAKLRVRVREEIREIQQELGITTVIVTHDQEEAMAISDRVAVMNAGRIEQVSVPDQLYRAPATEFVADFIGSSNKIPALDLGAGVPGEHWMVRPEDVRLTERRTGDDQPDEDGALPGEVVRL